ncbi:MAG TPA: PASTA domain-containing protein, partial [Cyclobacteriaceae bacterium]|nr:PASTA domain-containing protein [Cyclobacteriaceae bacterium]
NELKRGHVELVRGPFQIVTGMKYKGHPIQPGERVPKGSVIDLVVMDGGVKDFTTPNLLGKEWDEAEFQVIGSDLNIDIKIVGDTTGVVSVVLKQKPEAGEKILIGDIVTIWIGAAGTPVEEDDFN